MKGQRRLQKTSPTHDYENYIKEFDAMWAQIELIANGGYGKIDYKTAMMLQNIINAYKHFWHKKFNIPINDVR